MYAYDKNKKMKIFINDDLGLTSSDYGLDNQYNSKYGDDSDDESNNESDSGDEYIIHFFYQLDCITKLKSILFRLIHKVKDYSEDMSIIRFFFFFYIFLTKYKNEWKGHKWL